MNPMTRTLIYVGVAVVTVGLAIWKGLPTPEINPQDFAEVGTAFYPDFTDPNEATGIRVVVYNPDTDEVKPFEVKSQNNNWLIPSHYNYPADGKEQLSKTATSLVAVKRGVVAGESELDFERLGVVDPLSDDKSKRKGRGERLTLSKGSEVLLDIIIGKQVEDRQGFYYVRKPDEKLTFIAELDVDLSTKFGEWIEPDLLQVDPTALREIIIRDYSIDEASRGIKFNDILEIQRPDASTPWKLEGLKEEAEELKTAEINSMITAVDELKISGVRPKPAGMSADLKLSGSFANDPLTMLDMQSKGYFIVPTSRGGVELLANEGDVEVVTAEGVAYMLRFGEFFTGNEFEIEVGSAQPKTPEEAEKAAAEKTAAEQTEATGNEKQNRYLFVTVRFDEGALGPEPVKPTPPTEGKPTEATPDTETAESTEEKPTDEKPAADEAQKAYEAALQQYETELAAYELKVKAGQKKVEELNARFADWYYVIDAASFDKLHKSRTDLVEAKKPAEPETTPPSATETPAQPPVTPPVTPPAASPEAAPATEKPEMKAPATEPSQPAAEPAKPEAPAAEKPAPSPAPPAGEVAPAEKPVTPPAESPEKPATEPEPAPAAEEKSPPAEEKPAN